MMNYDYVSNDQIIQSQGEEIERLEAELAASRKERERLRDTANTTAHVIVEAGVIPGIDYPCRCDECKVTAQAMDDAGYMDRIKAAERWWAEAAAGESLPSQAGKNIGW